MAAENENSNEKRSDAPELGLLEEDDDFEEFPAKGNK